MFSSAGNIQLDRSESVLAGLSELVTAWVCELKKFDKERSLGKVTYRGESADAGGVMWSLFHDMKEVSFHSCRCRKLGWDRLGKNNFGFNVKKK